ncbi:FtsH protease activity modulator HflK [Methylocella sp.]|uniref:FtsH protease activity modulator HflK n=1 Tax=Methylocella sp. TaxID=1978226 RepID=UPI003784F5AD
MKLPSLATPSAPRGRPYGFGARSLLLLCGVLFIGWISTGFYNVQPDEEGLVLRFGRWVDTAEPGLHYHLPAPIERVLLPNVTQIRQLELGRADAGDYANGRPAAKNQMLTGDENIVEADGVVYWQIKNAGDYMFRISDPEAMLKTAAEGSLRQVVSRTPIQDVLSDKRQQVADQAKDLLQAILDAEHSGVLVTQLQLLRVDPPAEVIDAFNDVQRAKADKERSRNEAEAYQNDIIPRARGDAARVRQEADAYKAQVVNIASGEAASFLSVYKAYEKAKDVTSWRLYMDAVDGLLKRSSKVVIQSADGEVSNVVPFMPLAEGRDKPGAAR